MAGRWLLREGAPCCDQLSFFTSFLEIMKFRFSDLILFPSFLKCFFFCLTTFTLFVSILRKKMRNGKSKADTQKMWIKKRKWNLFAIYLFVNNSRIFPFSFLPLNFSVGSQTPFGRDCACGSQGNYMARVEWTQAGQTQQERIDRYSFSGLFARQSRSTLANAGRARQRAVRALVNGTCVHPFPVRQRRRQSNPILMLARIGTLTDDRRAGRPSAFTALSLNTLGRKYFISNRSGRRESRVSSLHSGYWRKGKKKKKTKRGACVCVCMLCRCFLEGSVGCVDEREAAEGGGSTTHAVSRSPGLSFLSTNAHQRDGLVCDPVSIGIDVSGVKCSWKFHTKQIR